RAAFAALMLQRPQNFARGGLGGGFQYAWPEEGVRAFWTAVQEVDQRLRAASGPERIWRSWVWAYERGYIGKAALAAYHAIKDDWPNMLKTAATIFILQMVPGVNVVVDVVLLVEFGLDAIGTFFDIADTFKEAYDATSVEAMQRASAKMANTMVGLAAKIIIWAATWGVRKGAAKAKKYVDGKRFLDEHGNSREAREALSSAKGDTDKAREIIRTKREQERLAREKAAADARRAEEKRQHEAERLERERLERERLERELLERARLERERLERERLEREQKAQKDAEERDIREKRAQKKAKKAEKARLRREEHPDWPVVGTKAVRPYEATATSYRWNHNEGNFVDAEFSGGVLRVELKSLGIPRAPGRNLLDAVFNHFGPERIHTFQALWVKGTGYERNYLEYMKNLKDPASRVSREQAAWNTWTGREMKARGFTRVHVPEHAAGATRIDPEFTK
ncbi:MAG: hypothetical protein ACTHU0_37290, partial [Kofleriaceae bacterium]